MITIPRYLETENYLQLKKFLVCTEIEQVEKECQLMEVP